MYQKWNQENSRKLKSPVTIKWNHQFKVFPQRKHQVQIILFFRIMRKYLRYLILLYIHSSRKCKKQTNKTSGRKVKLRFPFLSPPLPFFFSSFFSLHHLHPQPTLSLSLSPSLSLPPSLPIKADPHGPACLLELPAITCETGESDLSREYLLILHSPNLVTWQT